MEGRRSRQRRASDLSAAVAPFERLALRESMRRNLLARIDSFRPGVVEVPERDPLVETIADAARAHRRPLTPTGLAELRADLERRAAMMRQGRA